MNCDTCRIAAEHPEAALLDKDCDDCIVRFLSRMFEHLDEEYKPSAYRAVCRDAGHVERIRERLFHLAKPAEKPTDTRVEW